MACDAPETSFIAQFTVAVRLPRLDVSRSYSYEGVVDLGAHDSEFTVRRLG